MAPSSPRGLWGEEDLSLGSLLAHRQAGERPCCRAELDPVLVLTALLLPAVSSPSRAVACERLGVKNASEAESAGKSMAIN